MVTYGHNTIGKPIDLKHSHLASAFFLALIPDNIFQWLKLNHVLISD